jgi:hypothetical protein
MALRGPFGPGLASANSASLPLRSRVAIRCTLSLEPNRSATWATGRSSRKSAGSASYRRCAAPAGAVEYSAPFLILTSTHLTESKAHAAEESGDSNTVVLHHPEGLFAAGRHFEELSLGWRAPARRLGHSARNRAGLGVPGRHPRVSSVTLDLETGGGVRERRQRDDRRRA